MLEWLKKMTDAGKWGAKSNKSDDVKNYEILHYAGSPPDRVRQIWKTMVKDFLTGYGPETPRWGTKCLWLCTKVHCVEKLNEIWPNLKWVICIRHPFLSFNSQRNTFVQEQDLEMWIRKWIASVKFTELFDHICVQMDQLDELPEEVRLKKLGQVFKFVGESPTSQTEAFVKKWPVIHKVRPNKIRKFSVGEPRKKAMLEKFPELEYYMDKMGYTYI